MLIRIPDRIKLLLIPTFISIFIISIVPVNAFAADSLLGDVNYDGKIDSIDASQVLEYYTKASIGYESLISENDKKVSDVNKDGHIDSIDASYILSYYSYISTEEYKSFSDYIIDISYSSSSYNTYYRSKTYLLYCIEDEQLISYHDIHTEISPASFTKLLTASVVMKYMNKEYVVSVGSEQGLVQPYSSLCYISKGQRLSIYDLLTGMLLASGNDASYTLAVNTARYVAKYKMSDSEAVLYFCKLMNEMAKEIGMNNSNFVNPDGYDAVGQYTTAADMLKLARYAMSIPEIRTITSTSKKNVTINSGQVFNWKNTNYLLDSSSNYYRSDAFGIKTGTTENAGTCLISAFNKNEKTYIIIVSGCSSDTTRYDLTISIIDTYV